MTSSDAIGAIGHRVMETLMGVMIRGPTVGTRGSKPASDRGTACPEVPMSRFPSRLLAPATAVAVAVMACVSPGATPAPSPSPGANDPAALILRVEVTGGFVPAGYLLTELPTFSLYADGRIVTQEPVPAIYPGPLLPNLQVRTATVDDVARIVAAAREAGLDGPDASYDATNIADAGTTVFTLVLDDVVHRISAYALFDDGIADPGMDADTRAARARLYELQRQLTDLGGLLGHEPSQEGPFVSTAARLFISDQVVEPDPALPSQVLPLPSTIDPAAGDPVGYDGSFRCQVVEDGLWAVLRPSLEEANALTVWETRDARYSILVRPLLPDEAGCPTAG